jgi:hypothetical protein
VENGWQGLKVYSQYVENGQITKAYWKWANSIFHSQRAIRYPMGKGAKPLFSLWRVDGELRKLGYIEARLRVYFRLYRNGVRKTDDFKWLQAQYQHHGKLVLFDFDGYSGSESLVDVMLNAKRPMGHAFVLKALLLYGPQITVPEIFKAERRVSDLRRLVKTFSTDLAE